MKSPMLKAKFLLHANFLRPLLSCINFHQIGSDLCGKLCEIAHEKGCQVVRSNVLSLPFKSSSADAAICIAVLHHLSTSRRRFALPISLTVVSVNVAL